MSVRVERFISTLKQSLADILINDINDPRLKSVIVKDIQISSDLKKAHVVIGSTADQIDELLVKLNNAKGFFKKNLAKKMYLKYVPDLSFVGDDDNKIK